jgi:adenosylcobinamide kinase/adenosylcobinamide-phosphate guanylyltransferase
VHFQSGVSLVLGGARSGKSAFAEKLASESGRSKVYLATGQARDEEMLHRIEHHQSRRGADWRVVEEPLNLARRLRDLADQRSCILVDCLTLWLSNVMMAKGDIDPSCQQLTETISALKPDCSVILVSNEVGQGIVPIEKMARDFRDHAGRLHQDLAAVADTVWFVTAGLPQRLK